MLDMGFHFLGMNFNFEFAAGIRNIPQRSAKLSIISEWGMGNVNGPTSVSRKIPSVEFAPSVYRKGWLSWLLVVLAAGCLGWFLKRGYWLCRSCGWSRV
jgi:hypothetical protein